MNIRRAVPGDAEALTQVHIGAWLTTYRGIIPEAELFKRTQQTAQRVQRWRDNLSENSSTKFVFVAADDEDVVGFASGGPERDGNPMYKGELWAIYILEKWQRKGIGRQLMLAVAQELQSRGFNSMLVWVLRDNPNRCFYERLNGILLSEKEIAFGEHKLIEVSYGWNDLSAFVQRLSRTQV